MIRTWAPWVWGTTIKALYKSTSFSFPLTDPRSLFPEDFSLERNIRGVSPGCYILLMLLVLVVYWSCLCYLPSLWLASSVSVLCYADSITRAITIRFSAALYVDKRYTPHLNFKHNRLIIQHKSVPYCLHTSPLPLSVFITSSPANKFFHHSVCHAVPYIISAELCRRAVSVRLSVCPPVYDSITFVYSVETNKLIFRFFHHRSHTILVFPHQTTWQHSDGDSPTGASNADGVSKNAILALYGFIACCQRFNRQMLCTQLGWIFRQYFCTF